jgi:hypothetical protein
MNAMRTMMVVLGMCALAGPAAAQTVYKCTVDGKVSYGERPCADGKTTALDVPPAPSGAEAAEAPERDKAHLAALQKERASVDAVDARDERERQRAARTAATLRQKCDRLRLQQKWAQEDAARAGKAAAAAARLKAKRQAEALAVQCPA